MNKNILIRIAVPILLATLSISFMSPAVQAGRPRGGGDLFMKYVGKIVTQVTVGPWGPWVWTSAVKICPNGLWSFDYTRYRTVTKTYWLAERWMSWAWIDNNIVFYERWRNFMGPFTYSITQRQMKQVYWFDRIGYDPRFPWAIQQTFYRDSLLWADWTGLDGVIDPGTGVPLQSHRVFFDEVPYYETGPHQPDGTDAMVIDLASFPAGPHMIRIEGTWANGTVSPQFLMVPLMSVDYLTASLVMNAPGVPQGMRTAAATIQVTNNFDENRTVYFQVKQKTTITNTDSFFDVFVDMDIPGNGTIIPAGSTSFFDVFYMIPPHTPVGEIIQTEIIALDLSGMALPPNPCSPGHSSQPIMLQTQVMPPPQTVSATPSTPGVMAFAGRDTVVLRGSGFKPGSMVGLTSSFFDVFFDTVPVDPSGTFTYNWSIPISFDPYGQHAFAAIQMDDGTSATANMTISGPDVNHDKRVDILDVVLETGNYGKNWAMSSTTTLASSIGLAIAPFGLFLLYKKLKRKPKS